MTRTQWLSLFGVGGALLLGAWLLSDRPATPSSPSVSASAARSSPSAAAAMPPPDVPLAFAGEPTDFYTALGEDPKWKELVGSGRRFSLSASHRPFGQIVLEGARAESNAPGAYRISADRFWLNQMSWENLTFSLRKRVETIELRQEADTQIKPIELNYTPGRGGALWLFALPHQPARPALQHYGVSLFPDQDATRLLTSFSLVVPTAADQPARGRLELVIDDWPKPEWPDAKALLGDTLSLGGRVEAAEQGSTWSVEDVRVSVLLFTLSGQGRIEWGRSPGFTLDANGERTCEQLLHNLGPSIYLEDVRRFLAANPGATKAKVELALHLRLDPSGGRREISWRLSSGCGLAAR